MRVPEGRSSTIEAELARLPTRDVAPERVERIRSRCQAALAAARRRREPAGEGDWRARVLWETAAAAGLTALYLAAVVERALELLR